MIEPVPAGRMVTWPTIGASGATSNAHCERPVADAGAAAPAYPSTASRPARLPLSPNSSHHRAQVAPTKPSTSGQVVRHATKRAPPALKPGPRPSTCPRRTQTEFWRGSWSATGRPAATVEFRCRSRVLRQEPPPPPSNMYAPPAEKARAYFPMVVRPVSHAIALAGRQSGFSTGTTGMCTRPTRMALNACSAVGRCPAGRSIDIDRRVADARTAPGCSWRTRRPFWRWLSRRTTTPFRVEEAIAGLCVLASWPPQGPDASTVSEDAAATTWGAGRFAHELVEVAQFTFPPGVVRLRGLERGCRLVV